MDVALIDGSELSAVRRDTTASFRVYLYQGEVVFSAADLVLDPFSLASSG